MRLLTAMIYKLSRSQYQVIFACVFTWMIFRYVWISLLSDRPKSPSGHVTAESLIILGQRRRDRGRRSQAAFRQRQADALHQLKAENQQMQKAIENLTSLVRGDERPELRSSISEAALAAGLQLPCPLGSVDTGDEQRSHQALSLGRDTSPPALSTICHTWFNPFEYTQLSQPPDDILPYLGEGAYTFAGCLFWSVMNHFQSDCKHHHSAEVMAKSGLDHSKATRDIKLSLIRSMLNARLEYKRTGLITAENAAGGEKDLGMVLHKQILREHRETGIQSEAWLRSLDVERLAKALFGSAFSALERAIQGEEESILTLSVRKFVCRLCASAICFGDGPRWHISIILRELSEIQSRDSRQATNN